MNIKKMGSLEAFSCKTYRQLSKKAPQLQR